MPRTTPKDKQAMPTPPATTPTERLMTAHELVMSPTIQGAVGILSWSKFAGEADLEGLVKDLREQSEKVQGGDMRPVEAMLYGQAKTLETMFTSLARRAASNDGLKQFQVNLTLALKTQAQCRATLEALAEIKNPRQIAFVKQANIANQQLVSNGVNRETASVREGAQAHARENTSLQNGLLEASHDIELDPRAQAQTGRVNPHLEAVGAGQRATHA